MFKLYCSCCLFLAFIIWFSFWSVSLFHYSFIRKKAFSKFGQQKLTKINLFFPPTQKKNIHLHINTHRQQSISLSIFYLIFETFQTRIASCFVCSIVFVSLCECYLDVACRTSFIDLFLMLFSILCVQL